MLTIFTPVYNRAYIIKNLYESLKRQTVKDFEWIVIDDGSSDNIKELFEKWIEEDNGFEIVFKSVINGGKHRAINKAVNMARSDAFFIVDSDDYITDDAVEFILNKFAYIKNEENYAGISGLRMNKKGEIYGGAPCIEEYMDATNFEREEFNLLGDKAEIYKTEILKKFPFPEYDGENFVTESVVWDNIAGEGYLIRWFNKAIYVTEYLEDGLSANQFDIYAKNPKGWAAYLRVLRMYADNEKVMNLYKKSMYRFYERNKNLLNIKNMLALLDIDMNSLKEFVDLYDSNIVQIKDIINENSCNEQVVLYGYGNLGRRFKLYLDELDMKVKFVIDKKYDKISDIEAYSLNMQLPLENELIVITIKSGAEEIRKQILERYSKQNILMLDDFKLKIF